MTFHFRLIAEFFSGLKRSKARLFEGRYLNRQSLYVSELVGKPPLNVQKLLRHSSSTTTNLQLLPDAFVSIGQTFEPGGEIILRCFHLLQVPDNILEFLGQGLYLGRQGHRRFITFRHVFGNRFGQRTDPLGLARQALLQHCLQ